MVIDFILGGVTATSAAILIWQHSAARAFRLRSRVMVPSSLPSLTLLKPMKGSDASTRECLRSWVAQEYPAPLTILCGVADANDPALAEVAALQNEFPHVKLHGIVCPESRAINPKVSTLIQLEPRIATPLVLVSDADVWVEPGFLAQAVAQLHDREAALLHCLYAMRSPANAPTTIEALGVNCDMWTQVLQSLQVRPANFALGAAILFTAETLKGIGGCTALGDHLADDNRLGALVAERNDRLTLGSVPVECRGSALGWGELWRHQVRWCATIRVCEPIPYFMSILSHTFMWALVWVTASSASEASLIGLGIVTALRLTSAALHWRLLTGDQIRLRELALLPLRDLLGTCFWSAAFLTRTVTWRGIRYRLRTGGRLEQLRKN